MILSGKEVAKGIKKKIAMMIEQCDKTPHLVTISVAPDPSTRSYINSQAKAAKKLGIDFTHRELTDSSDMNDLREAVVACNDDGDIHGILLAMPLPEGFNRLEAISLIDPEKDVEGITATNLGLLF